MDSVLDGLNPAQRAAVSSPSNVVQILAPPGSGKTKTLTARVAYLISHNGLLPRNVVVCTFTVKAAKEMKERICGLLDDDVSSKLILGTFHSIARRYLCAYGDRIGLNTKFGIADTSDTTAILRRIAKKHNSSLEASVVRSRISKQKAQRISPDQYAVLHRKVTNQQQQAERQEFLAMWNDYEDHLSTSNLLDYDDLLVKCVELLNQQPKCVANVEAVLVDEFQDTNSVQFELMNLIASHSRAITTVGDPDQSIYGWRSADSGNLQRFRDIYPDTHVAVLQENYRSSGAILAIAQEVIEQDHSRPAKALLATHSVGLCPVLRKLNNAHKEADWVVSEIRRLLDLSAGVLLYQDVAILLRSAALSRLIESALIKRAMPYRTVGGLRFFDRAEVRLVLDYLRVIINPDHDDAVGRILNVPARKIGVVTADKLFNQADLVQKSLWHIVQGVAQRSIKNFSLPEQACAGIRELFDIITKCRTRLQQPSDEPKSLADFVSFVIGKARIEPHLKATQPDEFEARWANVEELVTQAADTTEQLSLELAMTASEHPDESGFLGIEGERPLKDIHDSELARLGTLEEALGRFLANIALSTEVQKITDAEAEQPGGQITISTIHAAKGLEWPVVFVPAASEGIIPHSRAEDYDEERRLLYVAMTRAQAVLCLSCPLKDSRGQDAELSSFLTPTPMMSHFASRGASIGYDVVKEIASILRRPCPSSDQVCRARMSAEEVEDRFRAPGEESGTDLPPDLVDMEERFGSYSYTNKRRRVDESQGFVRPEITASYRDAYQRTRHTHSGHITTEQHSTFTSASKVPLQPNRSITNAARFSGSKPSNKPSRSTSQSQSSLAKWVGVGSQRDQENASISTTKSSVKLDPGRNASVTSLDRRKLAESNLLSSQSSSSTTVSLHQTSEQVFRERGPLAGPSTIRRAYGAKPSMNGWQARMARDKG